MEASEARGKSYLRCSFIHASRAIKRKNDDFSDRLEELIVKRVRGKESICIGAHGNDESDYVPSAVEP